MEEEYWNIKRNLTKYIQRKMKHDGYCVDCQRPLRKFSIRCTPCMRTLIYKNPIGIKDIGKTVINYQYYLSKDILGYVPNAKYRGLKQDRIRLVINKQLANRLLDNIILKQNNHYSEAYKELRQVMPNITNNILYNILMAYISYHIVNSTVFTSEANFMCSVTSRLHTDIRRQLAINTGKPIPIRIESYGIRYMYRLIEDIEDMVSRIIVG